MYTYIYNKSIRRIRERVESVIKRIGNSSVYVVSTTISYHSHNKVINKYHYFSFERNYLIKLIKKSSFIFAESEI